MTAIEIKDLVFTYTEGKNILNGISLKVEQGSFVSILGSNGSGKTTLAKLLVGLLNKKEGEVIIGGVPLNKDNLVEIRKNIVIVFQNPDNQFIGATVEDDIAFGMENRQIEHSLMVKNVKKFAALVDMSDYLDREPNTLSGGQKQRVAIAGALSLSPKIIIFDESTAMLDPKGKKEIHEVIRNMHETMPEITILSITHDMEEALLSDRIIYLKDGAIIMDDTPDNVFSNEKFIKDNKIKLPFIYELKKELKNEGFDVLGNTLEEVMDNVD